MALDSMDLCGALECIAGRSQRDIDARGALHPREVIFHFNLACYAAQLGCLDDARRLLDTACALDGTYVELTKADDDLTPLRIE